MACQCLRKIKGKWLSFCKYNKQRIMRSPRYLLTQRVRLFLEQGRDLNMPVGEAERIRKFLRWNLVGVLMIRSCICIISEGIMCCGTGKRICGLYIPRKERNCISKEE